MNTRMSIKAQVIENARVVRDILKRRGVKPTDWQRAVAAAYRTMAKDHPDFIRYKEEWFEAVK